MKELFDKYIRFAENLLQENNILYGDIYTDLTPKYHPVLDYIKLLGTKTQLDYMMMPVHEYMVSNNDLSLSTVFFDCFDDITLEKLSLYDIKEKVDLEAEIELSNYLVLPWPWKQTRLINSLIRIGEGRLDGEWEQVNQETVMYLPWGLVFVEGGNHSITTGIIQGKGKIKTDTVYEISRVFDYVYTDGLNYYRKYDGSIISEVKNTEFAAIFEIGRIMIEHNIEFQLGLSIVLCKLY